MTNTTAAEQPATVSDTIVAGRRVAEYKPISEFPGHSHSNDTLVGYVIRETIRDGKVLWHGEPVGPSTEVREHCGYDVAVVEGGHRYSDTFATRDAYRNTRGGYAVVDHLYSCGCRS